MDYTMWIIVLILHMTYVAILMVPGASGWQNEWRPNYISENPEYLTMLAAAEGQPHFKLLHVEGNKVFIGTRNLLYYLKVGDFQNVSVLDWKADHASLSTCQKKGKKECENYIRVMVKKEREKQYYICGTHAYQPRCRHYILDEKDQFKMVKDNEEGIGVSPFNPNHNSTAIYVDGKVFAATVADADERDPLILQKTNDSHLVRTQTRDSIFLNEPNFVSSHDKQDKVFFFFRETAVENINCGKAIFSRVARVCKNDRGSERHQNTFTSFFKARLNCSIPGEYPFYFDEIQSTSEFGQGNYRPTSSSGDRSDMIYGVFNTPENGIRGSAVCAFMYSKIEETFRGRFKGQESYLHNWLPVSWEDTPKPQPASCSSDSQKLSYTTLNFIKKHPLMDEPVPAAGGMPMLVFTSFNSKFTQIAVDWQVLAADGNYYDVMFIGTDDGRVIKAINKGSDKVESVVIEDIQVLDRGDAVVSLKVFSHRANKDSVLMVMSKRSVVSIPLHRCKNASTCSACVALQDPYCVWDEKLKCINAETGLQNISSGKHSSCPEESAVETKPMDKLPIIDSSSCSCANGKRPGLSKEKFEGEDEDYDTEPKLFSVVAAKDKNEDNNELLSSASTTSPATGMSLEIVIVAVIVSIIGSLVLGFCLGFMIQYCRYSRYSRDRDNVFYDRNYSSLQRGRNRLSSGDNPYFHTDNSNLTPKIKNFLVSPSDKTNSNMETKPMTKSNKVYV